MRAQEAAELELKAKLFRGFADPSRLAILELLRAGERSVSELVVATGLSQPSVSKHLGCLRECGLAVGRAAGNRVYYALAEPGPDQILAAAEAMLARVGERIYACTRYEDHSGSLGAAPGVGDGDR